MASQLLSEKSGKFLKQLIAGSGRASKDLAQAIGVAPTTVSKWVGGKQRVSWEHLTALARELDVSVSEIVTGERQPKPDTPSRVKALADREPSGIRRFDMHVGLGSRIAIAIDEAQDNDFTREELFGLLEEIRGWGEEAERTINGLYQELRRLSRSKDDARDS